MVSPSSSTGDCLRASSSPPLLALAVLVMGAACSGSPFVAVDPYPCVDGGVSSCGPGLLNDLVGYWRLNDGTGSTTAHDWSSWGNTGTLVNLDPATAWASGGPEGVALSVQGKGYVDVAESSSIDSITNQVTAAAWIYLDQLNTDFATAISRQIGTGFGQQYHVSINSTQQAAFYVTSPAALAYLTSPSTMPLQTWIHLAGTWDGSEARLYVDGIEVASAQLDGPLGAETNPVVLGGNGNGGSKTVSELVPGRLGDIMLYRRALAADEIARLASGPLLPASIVRLDSGGQ
jgi:large repetitive protein